eukprot:gene32432-31049_t
MVAEYQSHSIPVQEDALDSASVVEDALDSASVVVTAQHGFVHTPGSPLDYGHGHKRSIKDLLSKEKCGKQLLHIIEGHTTFIYMNSSSAVDEAVELLLSLADEFELDSIMSGAELEGSVWIADPAHDSRGPDIVATSYPDPDQHPEEQQVGLMIWNMAIARPAAYKREVGVSAVAPTILKLLSVPPTLSDREHSSLLNRTRRRRAASCKLIARSADPKRLHKVNPFSAADVSHTHHPSLLSCNEDMPTFEQVAEEEVYGRYLTVYNRTVEFTSTTTGQVANKEVNGRYLTVYDRSVEFKSTTTGQVTIVREYCQGPNCMAYCLPTGGYDPAKHNDIEGCAMAELSEE